MSRSQIKAGAIISYFQMGLNIIIGLVYTPVMIRLLGQSEYGLYNTVASTISMLSILRLGFNNSYIRYYSIYRKRQDIDSINKLNGIFLGLFCVIGFIGFICGLYLTAHLEIIFSTGLTPREYDTAKVLSLLLAVNLAISFPMSVFSNIISANERFIFLKALDIVKTLAGPMISLPLLFIGKGSIGMVTVRLAVSFVIDSCYVYYVCRVLRNKFIFKSPEAGLFKDLIVYTSFIALELIVDQINWNIDKILLARYKGTKIVAIYTVGYSLYTYYQNFSCAVSGVFTPRIHAIVNSTDKDRNEQRCQLTSLFTKVGRVQFIILGLLATGIVFFGRFFIVRIWAGEEYRNAYFVALLLIIPASVALIQNLGIEIQRAENRHQFRSIVYTFMAAANLIMSIQLCQLYGAIGCAIGTAISLIAANGFIMNIYYHKKCNMDMRAFWLSVAKLTRGIIIPIVTGCVITVFGKTNNLAVYLVEIAIYTAVYGISMWSFGMNHYEKHLVISVASKLKR